MPALRKSPTGRRCVRRQQSPKNEAAASAPRVFMAHRRLRR